MYLIAVHELNGQCNTAHVPYSLFHRNYIFVITKNNRNDPKGPENIICTTLKRGETFWITTRRLTPAAVKITNFWKRDPLEERKSHRIWKTRLSFIGQDKQQILQQTCILGITENELTEPKRPDNKSN